MKLFTFVLFALVHSTCLAQDVDYVIKDVSVIDMATGKVKADQSVALHKGKIIAMGKQLPKTITGKITIYAAGKYLIPALYDMHVHWPSQGVDTFMGLNLAAGVTTLRIMNSEPEAVAAKKNWLYPRMVVGFPVSKTTHASVANMPIWVDSIKMAGYDFIKVFSIADEPSFNALTAAAKQKGLSLCGHAPGNVAAQKVMQSGYTSIEHVGYFDKAIGSSLDSLINIAKANKTAMCPTLDWNLMALYYYNATDMPARAGYSRGMKYYAAHWDSTYNKDKKALGDNLVKYQDFAAKQLAAKLQVLKKLDSAGVMIIAGSDSEEPYQTPGFNLIEELKLFTKAGMSNFNALKTATINAATYLKEHKTRGTIAVGKSADVVLLKQNPLADLNNLSTVEMVWKDGKLVRIDK